MTPRQAQQATIDAHGDAYGRAVALTRARVLLAAETEQQRDTPAERSPRPRSSLAPEAWAGEEPQWPGVIAAG